MTNLKKLGLTALAGSLVATTGYAGALDVSGGAKVSYNSGSNGAVNGNPFSMTRDINFSGPCEIRCIFMNKEHLEIWICPEGPQFFAPEG